jgi:DNA repair protein RadC
MSRPTDIKRNKKVNEVELIYRRTSIDHAVVQHSETAYNILKAVWDENRIDLVEEFKILLMRRNNMCFAVSHISTGGVSGCIADAKIIFATALKANACQMILAHNHPSGNTTPSKADISLTNQLVEAAKLLDMKVLDHLILTSSGYRSLADDGLMP